MTKIIRSFAVYYLLTILLLALVPILSAVFDLSMDFAGIAAEASEQSGIPWTSNLFDVVRLSLIEPSLWLLILGSFVPTLAALVVLVGTRDRTGLWILLRRFNPLGLSHVPINRVIGNYALLTGGMLFCLTLTPITSRKIMTPTRSEPNSSFSLYFYCCLVSLNNTFPPGINGRLCPVGKM